jgi:cytochrome P450
VLLAVFCELAKHPHHADQVYKELEGIDVADLKALNRVSHLNAVINETLRLYPVLLTGGARKTLQDGMTIGDTYIPPFTTIVAPRFSISRSKRYPSLH